MVGSKSLQAGVLHGMLESGHRSCCCWCDWDDAAQHIKIMLVYEPARTVDRARYELPVSMAGPWPRVRTS